MLDAGLVTVAAHLLVLIVFANRYFVGNLIARIKGDRFDPKRDDYEPSVTIVIPMFNEGPSIAKTVRSLLAQEYPADKLRILVVDDCSTDDSYEWAMSAARESDRVTVLRNPVNMGKRRGINRAVRTATSEIIVSVDSDVIVADNAVRELVARFVSDEVVAVGGRVNVLNRNQNWLTKMQTIKYFFGYEYLKTTERAFQTVMCLSGCLTAYRRHVLLELEPILESRTLLGIPIKYGEDRFLTRQIIKAGYKTTLTLDAVCYTKAPATLSSYFSQQLRWRRSNLVDYVGGLSHVWKRHPVVSVHYFALFGLLVTYPMILLSALASGTFFDIAFLHLGVLAVFGLVYRIHVRSLPADERVPAIYFLAMAVIMPVTYMVLTPLALFTLDSGSWETRGHTAEPVPAAPAEAVRAEPVLADAVRLESQSA